MNETTMQDIMAKPMVERTEGFAYAKPRESLTGHFTQDLPYQFAEFSFLTYPEYGMPVRAGKFFTISMNSGKTGMYFVVASAYKEDAGECLAFFVGYAGEPYFYTPAELCLLLKKWKSLGLSIQNSYYGNYREIVYTQQDAV